MTSNNFLNLSIDFFCSVKCQKMLQKCISHLFSNVCLISSPKPRENQSAVIKQRKAANHHPGDPGDLRSWEVESVSPTDESIMKIM